MSVRSSSTHDVRVLPLYRALAAQYGPQHWWPGDSPFEIMVGAILTQNTSWRNVEKAIRNLKEARVMDPHILWENRRRIPRLVKPSGFYRLKAKRLVAFLEFYLTRYDGRMGAMKRRRTALLRRELLSVNGIGKETADSMLLYALNRPVFVIDAYTRRIGVRHDLCEQGAPYDAVQTIFERSLPRKVRIYNEFHALLVRIGKDQCRKNASLCDGCPVQRFFTS